MSVIALVSCCIIFHVNQTLQCLAENFSRSEPSVLDYVSDMN